MSFNENELFAWPKIFLISEVDVKAPILFNIGEITSPICLSLKVENSSTQKLLTFGSLICVITHFLYFLSVSILEIHIMLTLLLLGTSSSASIVLSNIYSSLGPQESDQRLLNVLIIEELTKSFSYSYL